MRLIYVNWFFRKSAIAHSLVTPWGMNKGMGPVDLRQHEEHLFRGQSITHPRKYAYQTVAPVDQLQLTLHTSPHCSSYEI